MFGSLNYFLYVYDMERTLKDGRHISKEIDRYNPITKKIETVTHYSLLTEQRRFLFRVLTQLQPIEETDLSDNERYIKKLIERIIDTGEYTSNDTIKLELVKDWYIEYMDNPKTIMTSIGHEIRQLKVDKWYTNPKYDGIKYCKIHSIEVCRDVSNKNQFYNSIVFSEIIKDNEEHKIINIPQSNPRYDDEMREVPDEVISKIIGK